MTTSPHQSVKAKRPRAWIMEGMLVSLSEITGLSISDWISRLSSLLWDSCKWKPLLHSQIFLTNYVFNNSAKPPARLLFAAVQNWYIVAVMAGGSDSCNIESHQWIYLEYFKNHKNKCKLLLKDKLIKLIYIKHKQTISNWLHIPPLTMTHLKHQVMSCI